MLTALLEVILPVVLIVTTGFALAKAFTLDDDTIGKINLYGLTPLLAFDALLNTPISRSEVAGLVSGYLLVTAIGAGVAWLLTPRSPTATRRGVVGCVILGNNGNFGLPIALLALGQAGFDQAIVLFLVSVVVIFTLGPGLLGASQSLGQAVVTVLKLPVSWALVAAPLIRLLDITLPVGVTRGVAMMADAAVPMVLIALGVQMAHSTTLKPSPPTVLAVLLRVVLMPLVAWGVAAALQLPALTTASLVLCWAMPTAVNVFMLAREYGSDPEMTASAVVLSTLASVVTIAVVLTLVTPV